MLATFLTLEGVPGNVLGATTLIPPVLACQAHLHHHPKATPNNYRVKAAWGKLCNSTPGGKRHL
jgi:hypothetical protein